MELYQRPYFTLFSEICDTIESLEAILQTDALPEQERKMLQTQIENLKNVQQETEAYLISQPIF